MYSLSNLILSSMISSFLYTFMLANFQNIKLKSNFKKTTLMFIVLSICVGSSAKFFLGVFKIASIYTLATLFNYLIFNRNIKESAIYSLITYAILILSEIIGVIIIMLVLKIDISLETINEYNAILHVIIVAVSMILLNIAIAVFRKIQFRNYVRESERHRVILYLGLNLLILSGVWIYLVTNSGTIGTQIYNIAMILILISTNVALILFQSNLSVKEKLIKSISEEKKRREMYIEVMEELMDNIKSFKHDYGNSIRTLSGYIEEDDNMGAMNFLRSLSNIDDDEKILQYYELKYLNEAGLKGLIISKVSDMIKKELDFTISIDKSNRISEHNIDLLDLSRVIGIIIDNAMEASELSDSKKLFINVLENKCSTEIVVSNSFSGDINISNLNKRGYSTKGSRRGTGLYNAEQILLKYENANIFTSINHNMFFQKIELFF